MGQRRQRRTRLDKTRHDMNTGHWYGIAFLGGALLGFFVVARQSNDTIDAIYNSGWTVFGGH